MSPARSHARPCLTSSSLNSTIRFTVRATMGSPFAAIRRPSISGTARSGIGMQAGMAADSPTQSAAAISFIEGI